MPVTFRKTLTRDNFASTVTTRNVTTRFTATGANTTLAINPNTGYVNPGTPAAYLPGIFSPWILTPFNKKAHVDNGRTYVTEYQFDNKGSVVCTRAWKGNNRGTKDRVVSLTLGTVAGKNRGLPTKEIVSGGDYANLGIGSLCSLDSTTSNGRKYTFDHDYQFLTLRSTRIGSFPYRYRADIDRHTGFSLAVYNSADQKTTLSYDQLGRLRHVTPETSLKEATTEYQYHNPPGGIPSIESYRRKGGLLLTKSIEKMDYFGRKTEEIIRRPVGNTGFAQSKRLTTYDYAGLVRKVTTLQPINSMNSSHSWRYYNYDAFGRALRIVRPDGTVDNRIYSGDRHMRSTVKVRTSLNGETNVATNTIYDSKGRVVKTNTPEYTSLFTYDPYDQKASAQRKGPGVDQIRRYGWDARGSLLWEKHPEIAGNGQKHSYTSDALGLTRRSKDGLHDLTHLYDGNGRPTRIRNTVGGLVWKDWTYATGNSGNNYQKGKVTKASRHNYPSPTNDWMVEETYEYRGKLGNMSQKTTQLVFPNLTGNDRWDVTFRQSMTYDFLGNLASESYPTCITTPQNGYRFCNDGPNDLLAPNHTVTRTYNQGMPRRVQSNLGPWAQFDYHSNLQPSKTTYSNGIVGIFNQGTNGMVRSARRLFKKGSAVRFDTGLYGFDGAGNIWKTGNDRYVYDRAGRLTYGSVSQASSGSLRRIHL